MNDSVQLVCLQKYSAKHTLCKLAPRYTGGVFIQVQGFAFARSKFGTTPLYAGALQCFLSILKNEGPLGLYKGTFPAIIKVKMCVPVCIPVNSVVTLVISWCTIIGMEFKRP